MLENEGLGLRLTIATFLFSQPKKWKQLKYENYAPRHVNALWRACAENIKIPHRFIAYTDKPDGILCERRQMFPRVRVEKPDGISVEDGCYSRLRFYDPDVQAELGTEFVAILDLDIVFMQDATDLMERCLEHDFTILEGSKFTDGSICNYYNGSIQICRSGARPQFWREFDPQTFYKQRARYRLPGGRRPLGTDQAWFCVRSGNAEHTIGRADGVYQHRTLDNKIPENTKILVFSGRDNPWSPAVKDHSPDAYARWKMYDVE